MRLHHAALALPLVLMTSSVPSFGQMSPAPVQASDPEEDAARYYEEGVSAAKRGDLLRAREAFMSAWRLKRHFQIAANLGMTELQLGQHRGAAEHLSFALREGPQIGGDELRRMQAMLDEARKHVGALDVDVSRPGAEVLVDRKPVGTSPLPQAIFVTPGTQEIEARLPGYSPARATVEVGSGESRAVVLTLFPLSRPRVPDVLTGPADSRRDARDESPPYWPIGVAASVAGAGLAAGVAFTLAANDASAEAREKLDYVAHVTTKGEFVCGSGKSEACPEIANLLGRQDTFQDLAVAGYVLGGVAAAGAVGLAIWSVHGSGSSPGASITPIATPRVGALVVQGTF